MKYKKYKRKDGKPKDPKKQRMGRRNKANGAHFETRLVKLYRKYGWHVQQNTKGIYDLVCTPPRNEWKVCPCPFPLYENVVHMLQPTLVRYPPKSKLQNLKDNNHKWAGKAYLVQREPKTWKLIFTAVSDLK